MEKLSLEKFDASKMSKDAMFSVKGGVATSWKGSKGDSGADDYNSTTGVTQYDDGCYGLDGEVHCP